MMSIVAKQRVMMTGLVQELVLKHKPMTAELQTDVRGVNLHTAEFQHPKGFTFVTNTLTGIEDGASVIKPDKRSDNNYDK
jgi:hypothetical protein